MKLSTNSVPKPVDNRRTTDAEPDSIELGEVVCDPLPNSVWAFLVVISFIAGVATGLLFVYSLTGPL